MHFNKIKETLLKQRFVINYLRMWRYVKPVWFRAICSMLICIPIGSLDAIIALALKPYMDMVMVDKSIASPWYIPLGIVAFTAIQGSLKYLASYLSTWVGGKISNGLKYDLFKKLLTFNSAYFDKQQSGDIIMQYDTMADMACSGLLENVSVFIQRICSSISLVAVLFYNSWQLAIIATIVLGCAFAPVAKIQQRIKSVFEKVTNAYAMIYSEYNEVCAGNKTIASYNLEESVENKFYRTLQEVFKIKIKLVQRTQWLSPFMHVIVSVGIGIAIGYGSHLILTGKITSGNFVSFLTALILLYTPVKSIGNNLNSVQMSFFAIEGIFDKLDAPSPMKDKEDAIELNSDIEKIEYQNVCFEYNQNVPVLKNINLTINKGETVAFVGNSGGGKTTLVNILPRFYAFKTGSVKINGIDIRQYKLESLRQNIAVVFQDNFLFAGTIRDNIMLGNKNATEEQLHKAVKMACLEEFTSSLQKGLDTEIGERGILLSGGQKQRVAIARAFLKNSPIIILDEATSALDSESEAIVQQAFDNLMKDKTVLVIAHRLSTIKNADKIAVIDSGNLAELGSHDELMQIKNGKYKSLFELQYNIKEQTVPAEVQ